MCENDVVIIIDNDIKTGRGGGGGGQPFPGHRNISRR